MPEAATKGRSETRDSAQRQNFAPKFDWQGWPGTSGATRSGPEKFRRSGEAGDKSADASRTAFPARSPSQCSSRSRRQESGRVNWNRHRNQMVKKLRKFSMFYRDVESLFDYRPPNFFYVTQEYKFLDLKLTCTYKSVKQFKKIFMSYKNSIFMNWISKFIWIKKMLHGRKLA